jgi:hypothetical protein
LHIVLWFSVVFRIHEMARSVDGESDHYRYV